MQIRWLTPALVELQEGTANQAGEGRVEGTASRPEQSKFKMEDCMNKDHFELAPEISGKWTAEDVGYYGQVFVGTRMQAAEIDTCWSWKSQDLEMIKKGVVT